MKIRNIGKLLLLAAFVVVSQYSVYAASGTELFVQHYSAGQTFLEQHQYSSAIVEFRKALKVNYLDNSARTGLINSYLARAAYYANNEKNYDKAANDFRSAIFYLKMFPNKEQATQNSSLIIGSSIENLNQCLKVIGFDKSASSRYKKAEELRALGNFSASAYEFSKASESSDLAGKSTIQIADLMKLLGNEPRSADYYKTALDLMPNDGLLRMKYARTLDRLGNYDEALVQYNLALANSKGDAEVLYALERIYINKLAKSPTDAELNANLGAIKQEQGDFESALNYYGKAEQYNPENITTRINVGTLFQQTKEYAKALKSYDSVLTLYPNNIEANLYKAQVLSAMGNSSEALKLYEKVLSLDPNNTAAKTEIVSVMQKTLSVSDFVSYINKNYATNKVMQNILYDYAYKLHKENKINDAIVAYKGFINNNPEKVDAYVNLAICYASNGDYKNAQSILSTAKTKFPSNNLVIKTIQDVEQDVVSDVLSKANSEYEKKDYKKAIEIYRSINIQNEALLIGIAASYQALNDYNSAIEYYKKAEVVAPKNDEIPYCIGYLYSEQQKWAEAEQYLKKAVSLNPSSDAKNLLSYVNQNTLTTELNDAINLFEKNNFEQALIKFNNVIKKESNNAYAYYYRAMIYDEQKKTQLAINDYINVLKYSKEIPIANYSIAVDYDSLGKYKEAIKYYNDFVTSYSTEDEYLKYAKERINELKPYAN